ncbi:hypothetical protein TKK_0014553 [Trichogramma kaykai]
MTLFKLKYRDRPLKICIANSLEDLLNSAKEKFDLDPDETYKITLDQDGTEIEEYEVLDQLANLSNEPIVLKVMSENNEELNPLVQVNPVIAAQNITTQFENGKVLTSHEKKRIKTEIVDYMLMVLKDTTAGTARKFAEALCERYRASFITEIPGLTFYNHDDFFKQSIYNALNYSKGKSNSVKRKASDDSDDEAVKEKEKEDELRKRQDQYGCVNFSPSLPEDENTDSQEEKRVMLMKLCENPGKNQTEIINLIKATYPSVRKELNEKIGIYKDVKKVWQTSLESRAKIIRRYFKYEKRKDTSNENIWKEAKSYEQLRNDKISRTLVVFELLFNYFKEESNELYQLVDEFNDRAIVDTEYPIILIKGSSMYADSCSVKVIVKQDIEIECKSPLEGIFINFLAYYVFGYSYNPKIQKFLEFLQRVFFMVNSTSGTKRAAKKNQLRRYRFETD